MNTCSVVGYYVILVVAFGFLPQNFGEWQRPVTAIFTGRNGVVAKVMFLQVCAILFTGGVCV